MGLMDMFGKKSPLVDCQTYLSNIAGKFSGVPQATADGDFSVRFVPDDKKYLLNRNKVANPSGMMDLKVKLDSRYKQAFLDAAASMADKPVFVSGVLVNDDSNGGRAEVHPLDMIYSPMTQDQFPHWFRDIQSNLKDPGSVLVYKIAAASDASKSSKPPQAEETRSVQASFPYPPKPNFPKIKIDFEIRKIVNSKTDFRLDNNQMRQRIDLELSVESTKGEGPGVFTGDLVAYWGNE